MSIHSPQRHRYTCVSSMHVESTCICVLIECPRKQHRVHMCWYCACWINLLYMLNLPAVHVESTCIRVNRMSQKTTQGTHVCCSCSVLKWHMQSNTHVRTAQALGNTCTLCWIPGHSINMRLHVVSAHSFLECSYKLLVLVYISDSGSYWCSSCLFWCHCQHNYILFLVQ